MRAQVRLFKDTVRNRVHFIGGKLGMDIGFDMWISIPKGIEFFLWLEEVIVATYDANNLTSITKINRSGDSDLLELEFNLKEVK